jgi:hypothetical protein
MPCICHGAETSDEYMNRIINTEEYKIINKLLKEAAELIKKQYANFDYVYRIELDESNQHEAWIKAFTHHLKGCTDGQNHQKR